MRRGRKASPSHTGAILDRTTPRIATSGALTIGVKAVPPMPPSEEMVKVAPCISAGASLPARAFSESSPSSRASSITPFWSTSLTTATTSPSGVSTATPRCQYFRTIRESPAGLKAELKFGKALSVATVARIRSGSSDTR